MNVDILKFKNNTELLKFIDENEIQFIDMNFTDIHGKWHHTAKHVSVFNENILKNGMYFDGSSISGWKEHHESDMNIRPDISKVCIDPFAAQKTIKIFCNVYDPATEKPYECDPRHIAQMAEKYLKKEKFGDAAYFGAKTEFFIFEDIKINIAPNNVSFQIDSEEGTYNSNRNYETGNMGHRPKSKDGYFQESPIDSLSDIRGEMVTVMQSMGLNVEKHHHEIASGQCEIGIKYSTLVDTADNIQIYKHVVQNVANSYGKTATFMPKPIFNDNGSSMHVHQSIWKNGKSIFSGNSYAGLSETALFYIGGIIQHAKALNAFTNPTTNSYKRLIPNDYETPVLLAYSEANRSVACRIPKSTSKDGKRVEIRFPDPCSNPYLALAAMLMAGIDGINNKIHPGEAIDKNVYNLPKVKQSQIPTVCHSLREALNELKNDNEFLLKGDVFSESILNAYIDLKMKEVEKYETIVHPIEYAMYYSS